MIKSFRDGDTEKIWHRHYVKSLSQELAQTARRKLIMIDQATTLNTLRVPPSNHLEKLSGDRAGQYSIRVNKQWRICFNWENGNAYNVELIDYH